MRNNPDFISMEFRASRAISNFHIDDRKETKFHEISPLEENFQRVGSRSGCRDAFAIVCKVLEFP